MNEQIMAGGIFSRPPDFKENITPLHMLKTKSETFHVEIRKNKLKTAITRKRIYNLIDDETIHMTPEEKQYALRELYQSFEDRFDAGMTGELTKIVAKIGKIIASRDDDGLKCIRLDRRILRTLIEMLDTDPEENNDLLFEVISCLETSTYYEGDVEFMCDHGIIDKLMKFLETLDFASNLQLTIIWTLSNICGDDNLLYRNMMIKHPVLVQRLLNFLEAFNTLSSELQGDITWFISNLCRGKPYPTYELVSPFILGLVDILSIKTLSTEVIETSLGTLADLTTGENYQIQEALDTTKLVDYVCRFLTGSETLLQAPAVRIAANICSSEDAHVQILLNAGFLGKLKSLLLTNRDPKVRSDACWALSGVLTGNEHQIQMVIEADLFKILQQIQERFADDLQVQQKVLMCYSNCTINSTAEQLKYLVFEANLIDKLLYFLTRYGDQSTFVILVLEAIDNILLVGRLIAQNSDDQNDPFLRYFLSTNGPSLLEELQRSEDDKIYDKTYQLIEKYFDFVTY